MHRGFDTAFRLAASLNRDLMLYCNASFAKETNKKKTPCPRRAANGAGGLTRRRRRKLETRYCRLYESAASKCMQLFLSSFLWLTLKVKHRHNLMLRHILLNDNKKKFLLFEQRAFECHDVSKVGYGKEDFKYFNYLKQTLNKERLHN